MQPDTTPDLDNLERLEKAATPGPWLSDAPGCVAKHYDEGGKATAAICGRGFNPSKEDEANANLIAAARNALPWLFRAARERDELRARADYAEKELGRTGAIARDKIQELRARAEKAEARLRELEADVCSVCMGTGLPGGCTSAACQCGDGSRAGELTAPYRARAERAEADLAESKRLVEKAEARAKELEVMLGELLPSTKPCVCRKGVVSPEVCVWCRARASLAQKEPR